ncbi:MAG: PQQ-like beta-propeller repeat protein [Chthonomonadales bacterium]|nr:PQQ-like beta-propeller repeat protein [Chthonomonadales bacterium]
MARFLGIAAAILGTISLGLALARPTERQPGAIPRGQWGAWQSRNMVASGSGLPDRVDPASGLNLRWSVPLGGQTHGTPVVVGDRVLIGTNNERPRDSQLRGDCGVLLCLDLRNGALLWQLVVPKVGGSPYNDWPGTGLCSAPTVEGDRVYVLSNRNELLCLDMQGMGNGNDGPFRDEGRYMVGEGKEPIQPGARHADILWRLDLVEQCGIHRHDAAHGSPVVVGDVLYINTSNGVDDNHMITPALEAPNLVAVHKRTGRLLARDGLRIGERNIHAAWSSPAYGTVGSRRMIFFGGPDGVCYAFEALAETASSEAPLQTLREVWRYDGDPDAPKQDIFRWQDNRKEGPSTILAMPVVAGGRVYTLVGGDLWHGKPQSWLHSINPSGDGDITRTGAVWTYAFDGYATATPAAKDGLAYVVSSKGVVHCVDTADGKAIWQHDTRQETWASPILADGKLYVTTRNGGLVILAAGRTKRELCSVRLDGALSASPAASGDTLVVATMRTLYAFGRVTRSGSGETKQSVAP